MGEFLIQDGQTVLMQGDSITDAGRRGDAAPYGRGYVSIFREMLTAFHPERKVTIINKGIGGDRTTGLKERWEDDVIRHQPDWLTLLIGINDLHSYLRAPDDAAAVTPEVYAATYDWLLEQTTQRTSARIVLLDPFYISINSQETFRRRVLDLIPTYIDIVHQMAAKYDTLLVKTHDIFAEHLQHREAECFCPEPVHPNQAGHIVIAGELIKTFGGI